MARRQSTHNAADNQEVADDQGRSGSPHGPAQEPSRSALPGGKHDPRCGIVPRMGIDLRRAPDPFRYGVQVSRGLCHPLSPVSALVFTMMGDQVLCVTDPHERKWAPGSC